MFGGIRDEGDCPWSFSSRRGVNVGELVRSPEWDQWTRTGNGGPTYLFNNH
jgi:hypothetical protein